MIGISGIELLAWLRPAVKLASSVEAPYNHLHIDEVEGGLAVRAGDKVQRYAETYPSGLDQDLRIQSSQYSPEWIADLIWNIEQFEEPDCVLELHSGGLRVTVRDCANGRVVRYEVMTHLSMTCVVSLVPEWAGHKNAV